MPDQVTTSTFMPAETLEPLGPASAPVPAELLAPAGGQSYWPWVFAAGVVLLLVLSGSKRRG